MKATHTHAVHTQNQKRKKIRNITMSFEMVKSDIVSHFLKYMYECACVDEFLLLCENWRLLKIGWKTKGNKFVHMLMWGFMSEKKNKELDVFVYFCVFHTNSNRQKGMRNGKMEDFCVSITHR